MNTQKPAPPLRLNMMMPPTRAFGVPPRPTLRRDPGREFAQAVKQFESAKKAMRDQVSATALEVTKYEKALAKAQKEHQDAKSVWNRAEFIVIARSAPPRSGDKRPREEPVAPLEEEEAPAAKRLLRRWNKQELDVLRDCGKEVDATLKTDEFYRALHKLFCQSNANKRRLRSVRKKAKGMGIRPDCEPTPQNSGGGSETESAKEESVV